MGTLRSGTGSGYTYKAPSSLTFSGFFKLALLVMLISGAFALISKPAAAQVSIGVGFSTPGYGSYYRRDVCDPYSRYYDPYYCDRGYYDDYYTPSIGNIVFYGGNWYRGPFRSRYYNGHNWYWINNGWRRHEWHGRYPRSMNFRNGGWYRDGRYGGYSNAPRYAPRYGNSPRYRNDTNYRSRDYDRRFNNNNSYRGNDRGWGRDTRNRDNRRGDRDRGR